MGENIFIKLISLLNKPIHYLFIGCCFIVWNYVIEKEPTYILLTGIVFILLSLASFVEFIIKKVKNLIDSNKAKQKDKDLEYKKQEQYRKQIKKIQQEYKELKGQEKEIINHCIKNNSRVFKQNPLGFENYSEAMVSLIAKGFAKKGSNMLLLVLNDVAWDALTKTDEVKNAK